MKPRTLAAVGGCLVTLASSPLMAAQASFSEVARESVSGVGLLKVEVPTALSDDGRVAFAAKASPGNVDDALFTWKAGTTTPVNLKAGGYSAVNSVAINSGGNVAFVADHTNNQANNFVGVYRTTTALNAPIVALREEPVGQSGVPKPRFVALSENGTVAYSTIVSGAGAIYRGPIAGAQPVLVNGSGTFFNTQRLDVNDAGRVAVQMEHTAPFGGLRRGIIVFDAPGQPLTGNSTAIEQADVSVQPMPSINAAGQVAFGLNSPVTMKFFNPPNQFSNNPVSTITLEPGVYVTTPEPFGLSRTYTKVADATGAFKTFGRVQLNDDGLVVFEATLDGAGGGIYAGGDPVADKLIAIGDTLDNTVDNDTLVSSVTLGELNNANQFSFVTSNLKATSSPNAPARQVWLATVPEPTSALAVVAALAVVLRRTRRRA